ncbi:chlorophyll synthesis pathway protein BchC [Aestuariibius sp. 2305UL40-4]|uniref:chlorophyll synthesis pathway protein BchC n=1 Tax=Aestuariibius violaceus TaxID=3234132 RepID=UPI00345E44AF
MQTEAVILRGPRDLALGRVETVDPTCDDLVVEISHSGVSTGTEKLFYTGEMPPFPGMGYPLVPGYEAAGEVVEAGCATGFKPGDRVFVPGANCYEDAHGLFGGAAHRIVTKATRAVLIDNDLCAEGALLALAATARHALAGPRTALPDLIVGHGVLGRLLARLTIAAGGRAPTVWEIDPDRREGASDYPVIAPEDDEKRDYEAIYDASGNAALLDTLIGRLTRGGEIVLAGFYADPVCFTYPPAFMKEARFRVSAEWTQDDLIATRDLIDAGLLSLAGLITHRCAAERATEAYKQAFDDPACLKMILDWKGHA